MRFRNRALMAMALATALSATQAFAQMGGMGGGGGGGGMGGMQMGGAPADAETDSDAKPEAPRPHIMKPISLDKFDKAVTAMFNAADLNHDGMVTLAELQQVIDTRRSAIIRQRFASIDTNHDGHIDFDEFSVWQEDMGSAASSQFAGYAGQSQIVPETLGPNLGDGERDEALEEVIEPLSATTITNANIHYRPGVTLADLLAYENARFQKVDTDHDGLIEQDELQAMHPHGHGGPGGGFGH